MCQIVPGELAASSVDAGDTLIEHSAPETEYGRNDSAPETESCSSDSDNSQLIIRRRRRLDSDDENSFTPTCSSSVIQVRSLYR